jgi:hypothetical protein
MQLRALTIGLALIPLASCVLRTDESVVSLVVPHQVHAVCPACGSTAGGDAVTVWIASSAYDGSAGVLVEIGGVPSVVGASLGPADGCLWALPVTTPPLVRGPHDVCVILPGGRMDRRENAYTAVPALLSLTPGAHSTGTPGPCRIASGDFDGDGAPDLAVAHDASGHTHELVILRNEGSAGFPIWTTLDTGGTTACIASAHLTPDGRADLLAVTWEGAGPSTARPFLSTGLFPQAGSSLSTVSDPTGFILADLDGDGDWDAVLGSGLGALVETLINDGSGNFLFGASISVGTRVGELIAGLFDTDFSADLAVCDEPADTVWFLRGRGDGSFETPVFGAPAAGPVSLGTGDLDGDGVGDLLVASSTGLALEIVLNDGIGSFIPQIPIPLASSPIKVRVLDFDGDGKADFLAIHGNELTIWCGDGAGGVIPGRSVHLVFTSALSDVEASDTNLDGFLDILVTEPSQNSVWICLNTSS